MFARPLTKWLLLATVLLLVAIAIGQRLHTVAHTATTLHPGRIYRSGQLDADDLRGVVQRLGIRSVINLRGPNSKNKWYVDELAVCRELNVSHVDVSWSAKQLPKPDEVEKLLLAYREQPYPMLIHCQAGADRTGLASALYLIDQQAVAPAEAGRRSLSVWYGHLAVWPYFEMDEFLDLFGAAKNKNLRAWLKDDYPQLYTQETAEPVWHEIIEPWER